MRILQMTHACSKVGTSVREEGKGIMITKKDLGARLRGHRLAAGKSLEVLSAETEIPESSLLTYERGQRVPPGLRLLSLMVALEVAPADLIRSAEAVPAEAA